MRFLVLVIIALLLAYALWPEQETPRLEDTFIGDEIKPLRKAQRFEQKDYGDALDKHREQMDAQEKADGG